MIVDRIENVALYHGLGERFQAAFRFLTSNDLTTLAEGRHDIDGDRLYAMISRYETRDRQKAKWEAHRQYNDVQLMIEGYEQIGYCPLDKLTVDTPYDSDNDAVLLTGEGDFITAIPGTFFIFAPHDAHMPAVSPEKTQAGAVKKAIVKVAVD